MRRCVGLSSRVGSSQERSSRARKTKRAGRIQMEAPEPPRREAVGRARRAVLGDAVATAAAVLAAQRGVAPRAAPRSAAAATRTERPRRARLVSARGSCACSCHGLVHGRITAHEPPRAPPAPAPPSIQWKDRGTVSRPASRRTSVRSARSEVRHRTQDPTGSATARMHCSSAMVA